MIANGQPAGDSPELTDLFARISDGIATVEEQRELEELLQQDSRVRQLWWEYIGLEAGIMAHMSDGAPLVDLAKAMGAAESADENDEEVAADNRPRPALASSAAQGFIRIARGVGRFVRKYPVISCAVAAVFIVLAVTTLALIPQPGTQDPSGNGGLNFVAQLVRTHEAQWPEFQVGTTPRANLQKGHHFTLDEGFAEIHFRRGATVILEGPAQFVVESDNGGRLIHGKLAADVLPAAKGFHIDTPLGRVVDLGTAFAIDAPLNGPLTVHCFRGSITYTPNGRTELALAAGEAVAQSDHAEAPQRMAMDVTRFVSNLRLHGRLRSDELGMIEDARFKNNVALGKPAFQSSNYLPSQYPASLATDGDTANFTHTAMADTLPSLTVDLQQLHDIDAVFVHNRDSCCGARLQDIFIDILDSDGKTVVFTSKNLNEGNVRNSPQWLAVGLPEVTGDKVRGQYVRIRREIIAGESNDLQELGNWRVLSVGEVQIFADPALQHSPTEGSVNEDGQ